VASASIRAQHVATALELSDWQLSAEEGCGVGIDPRPARGDRPRALIGTIASRARHLGAVREHPHLGLGTSGRFENIGTIASRARHLGAVREHWHHSRFFAAPGPRRTAAESSAAISRPKAVLNAATTDLTRRQKKAARRLPTAPQLKMDLGLENMKTFIVVECIGEQIGGAIEQKMIGAGPAIGGVTEKKMTGVGPAIGGATEKKMTGVGPAAIGGAIEMLIGAACCRGRRPDGLSWPPAQAIGGGIEKKMTGVGSAAIGGAIERKMSAKSGFKEKLLEISGKIGEKLIVVGAKIEMQLIVVNATASRSRSVLILRMGGAHEERTATSTTSPERSCRSDPAGPSFTGGYADSETAAFTSIGANDIGNGDDGGLKYK
jgi:hypothetical protein